MQRTRFYVQCDVLDANLSRSRPFRALVGFAGEGVTVYARAREFVRRNLKQTVLSRSDVYLPVSQVTVLDDGPRLAHRVPFQAVQVVIRRGR